MPNLDGKGPLNEGPMTGRRLGNCTDSPSSQPLMGYYEGRFLGRRGCGYGRRAGYRGYGRNGAFGRRFWRYPVPIPTPSKEETAESLNEYIGTLEQEIAKAKQNLSEIESKKTE